MANFLEAFNLTMKNEGGYVFDPQDAGGETYKGISRRFYPSWSGWDLIDAIKKHNKYFKKIINSDKDLQEGVQSFYKREYWDKILGDNIPSQLVASKLFDIAVNMGTRRAVEFLQEALNLLNRNEHDWQDIAEDGIIGKNTLNTLKTCLEKNNEKYLIKVLEILQGYHYIESCRRRPVNEKFFRGWLNRI